MGIAFSNICFEYWILLHYENTTRPFPNCDAIISYIHQNYDADYGKANDHYNRLKDKISNAISYAQRIAVNQIQYCERPSSMLDGTNDPNRPESPHWGLNPYTDIHLIFEALLVKGFIETF